MKLEPVAWALYWKEGDMCRVTHDEQDAVDWMTMAMNEADTPIVTPLYAIPDGYVVAPVELTQEMLIAGWNASEVGVSPDEARKVWKAQIAAKEQS